MRIPASRAPPYKFEHYLRLASNCSCPLGYLWMALDFLAAFDIIFEFRDYFIIINQIHNYNFYRMLSLCKIYRTQILVGFRSYFSRTRYINIREVRKTQSKKYKNQSAFYRAFSNNNDQVAQSIQSTQINKIFPKYPQIKDRVQYTLTQQQRFQHQSLKIGEKIDQNHERINKQSHQINFAIKNAQKVNKLFYIIKKDGHKLSAQQYVALFDKFVFLDNIQHNRNQKKYTQDDDDQPKQQMEQKYNDLLSELQRVMFKQAHAPQIYVKLIDTFSKTHNQYIFNKGFKSILLKIIKNQLMPQIDKSKGNPSIDKKGDIKTAEQEISVSEVLSIDNNIKLAQSLLRIYNHKTNQPSGQDAKIILSLLRSVIDYIHLPVTSNQVQNTTLQNLISQYMAAFPKLKLKNPIIKSLVKQILARVKNQGVIDKVKDIYSTNTTQELPQISMVNAIKKLLTAEKLILQQHKNSALFQQLLVAKQKNLQHNPFNILEHRISKHLIYLLPRCKFQRVLKIHSMEENGPLWQHIELIPSLTTHVSFLFTKIPIEVLSKCQLLSASYEEYESISKYLKNFYQYIVQMSKIKDFNQNQKINFFQMLANSYQLLFLILSNNVQSNIPKPIIHKCVDQMLVSFLIKRFVHLPSQLKIITMWYILQKDHQNQNLKKVVKQLIKCILQEKRDNLRPSKFNYKFSIDLWYVQLLAGNKKYHQIISAQQMVLRDEQRAFRSFQTLISQISNVRARCTSEESPNIPKYFAQRIATRLRLTNDYQKQINKIILFYKKKSIENCFFTQQQIQYLKIHSKNFMEINSKNQFISNAKLSMLREKIKLKLNALFARAELIIQLVDILFGKEMIKREKYLEKCIEIFKKQFSLMKYPGLLSPQNGNSIGIIRSFAPQKTVNQLDMDLNLKGNLTEPSSYGQVFQKL